jgi:TnpA family transposase
VGGIDEQLHKETYIRLSAFWKPDFHKSLDELLLLDTDLKQTKHRWLCSLPTSNTSKSINQTLQKVSFLKEIMVHTWDLSVIPTNRRKRLANIVRNNTNQYLQRMPSQKRYSVLVCFLRETLLDTTDSVIMMYNDFWIHAISEAKKAYELYQMSMVKSQSQAVITLTKASEMLIDERIENEEFRKQMFVQLSKEQVKEAIDIVLKVNKPLQQSYLHFLVKLYNRFKQFTPKLLKTLDFKIAFTKDNFDKGLSLVKDIQNGNKKKIDESAPTNFVSQIWQKVVFNQNQIQNQAYELCVLSILRDRLLSGDIFVEMSRKYADFNSFLIPKQHWLVSSESICTSLGGLNVVQKIDQKVKEFKSLIEPLTKLLIDASEIRLEDGILIISPLEAEKIPASAIFLQEQINKRLPQVGLVEMIQEVAIWTGYSKEFNENGVMKNLESQSLIYAALLANACNLSLADLARSSELEYRSLWWVANNYFSDENIKKANDLLINFHHKQWISSYWGGGTLSSSDGQRFPTSGKIRNAQALPKYFGYGKGVTFYTHTSDQYSQYGTKVISSTERDATYVLDEILNNETDLSILEHTTDTHGYSDLIFALFDLVGKSFAPRLRDIKNQRLYKIKSGDENTEWQYPDLKFTGIVNIDYLKNNADELQRVSASLQTGTVTASLLISKLQSYPRQNNLMYVLQAYGQLCKTTFICKYLLQLQLRHRINTQLNKGEQLHNLRAYLWFGGDGIIRKKQEHEQQITARMLNLLSNIVMVWNTIYIQKIVKQLKNEGFVVNENDFVHISPAPFEHINRLGKYSFNDEIKLEDNGLRALRTIKS